MYKINYSMNIRHLPRLTSKIQLVSNKNIFALDGTEDLRYNWHDIESEP